MIYIFVKIITLILNAIPYCVRGANSLRTSSPLVHHKLRRVSLKKGGTTLRVYRDLYDTHPLLNSLHPSKKVVRRKTFLFFFLQQCNSLRRSTDYDFHALRFGVPRACYKHPGIPFPSHGSIRILHLFVE